jgi:sortase A
MDTVSSNELPVRAPHAVRRPRLWVGIILLTLGLLGGLYPFLPSIIYRLHRPTPVLPYGELPSASKLLEAQYGTLPVVQQRTVPEGRRLLIPTIGVNVAIVEGDTEAALDKGGVWRIPSTSVPSLGGNTVLSGHRWKYLPPSSISLYLLDKVKDGDPIIILWDKHLYTYRVRGREIVTPNQTEILDQTNSPQLTIFTCTPIFSTSHRLVLYADLIS